MAGSYADVPSWRMAWDRDGSQCYKIDPAGAITQLTTAEITNLNDEDDDVYKITGAVVGQWFLAIIFPESRDLDAYWHTWYPQNGGYSTPGDIQVSTDTTNGFDGTWSTIATGDAGTDENYYVKPNYRTRIKSSTALGVKAVRFGVHQAYAGSLSDTFWRALHLYGEIVTSTSRLALWHPTADARITPAYFDWGNAARESSDTKQFRVKNLSTTQTAGTLRVAMDTLSDATPSVPAQHQLSLDGTTYLAQVAPADLGPGAISPIIYLKQTVAADAVLGLWAFRVFAEAGTWT